MDNKAVVVPHNLPTGKQKIGQAGWKNRRVLGDIDNLVTAPAVEGKPKPQITSPATRSFCAQLLANAQAEKNKKSLAEVVNKGGQIKVPAKKKADDKPTHETTVPRRELQLVGISSMLIACKYEKIRAPEVNDFIHISVNAYARECILQMEKATLGKLEWYLTVPIPYVFLVRYIKASTTPSNDNDQEMENMAFFFAELGLMNYGLITLPVALSTKVLYGLKLCSTILATQKISWWNAQRNWLAIT
ncbi:hypothetical protein RND71_040611 [Anisodus tanguticus]|uniref:Cyclin N-terminal domain-containing protein n=1 Tax=Anisodus tanguticus TaxID=243964 RepID=A0AAE1QSJ1_9SOLA|nr:hypothetical protein RND71_040611 [Anisodus tanguticus]